MLVQGMAVGISGVVVAGGGGMAVGLTLEYRDKTVQWHKVTAWRR